MKIRCQEHYGKTVKYAESIGDTTLKRCLEELKLREKNSNGVYEIELYADFSPYSFGFAERTADGRTGIVAVCSTMQPDESYAAMLVSMHGWSIHT